MRYDCVVNKICKRSIESTCKINVQNISLRHRTKQVERRDNQTSHKGITM